MDHNIFTLITIAIIFFLIGRAYSKSKPLNGVIRKVFGFIAFLFILDILFGSSNSQNSTNNYYGSSCDCDQDDNCSVWDNDCGDD